MKQREEDAADLQASPGKSCHKSPVKSMKRLENQDNLENQENIETTYSKTQAEQDSELEGLCQEPKSILGQLKLCQDPTQATETQVMAQGPSIQDILEVDSNVINYGQFICGKILGSTLQVINTSDTEH